MPLSRRTFTRTLPAAALAATALPTPSQSNGGLFQHGVASGDPLLDRVILWTRISPMLDEQVIPVEWVVAEDPSLSRVRTRGLTFTNSAFDYTVKVDVTRLEPNTTYYYQFTVRGTRSPIGRTKTLPAGNVDRIRLAVTSCSNHPYGFFNAYRMVANRADLDAVLHLGDYIYEYAEGTYGEGARIGRIPSPNREIVSLQDYRMRYAQYRTDVDLQEAHRQHPWIVVWDDHESANDSWVGGAQNHQANEGDWSTRRAVATQAWFEWLPVRENPFQNEGMIYRSFRFGNLLDLIMLDTRLAGRDQQAAAANSPAIFDPNRTLLGADQEAWFNNELLSSARRRTNWRFVGQQVMMGQVIVDAAGTPFNVDQWDGYQASRARFLQTLAANQINNVAVLTGDIHSSWGNEIAANPFLPSGYTPQAVEFVTTAVTSPAFEDAAVAAATAAGLLAVHPHIKYLDLNRRGYLLMDIDRNRVQGEWFHVQTITERRAAEDFARALAVASGSNRLTVQANASTPRSNVAPLVP